VAFTSVGITEYDGSIIGKVNLSMSMNCGVAATVIEHFDVEVKDLLTYLGNLPNVESDLSYVHDINTAGSSTKIVLGISPDDLTAYDFINVNNFIEVFVYYGCTTKDDTAILDCDSDPLQDCDGNPVFGTTTKGKPNGLRKFSGFISKVTRKYGEESVILDVLTHGEELDNYMLEYNSDEKTYVLDQELSNFEVTPATTDRQAFIFATDTRVSGISLYVRNPLPDEGAITLSVTSPSLGNFEIFGRYSSGVPGYITFLLPEDTVFVGGETNYFQAVGTNVWHYMQSTGVSINGWREVYNAGTGEWSRTATAGIRFRMFTTTVSTKTSFLTVDPSDIAYEALRVYNSEGGIITAGDIEETGTVVSYTFQTNTILEALEETVQLSPYNWWWSVDIADNIFNLKPISSTADHTIVVGDHIETLELEESIEDLVNLVYFSGGEVAENENLFIIEKDTDSMLQLRRGLLRMTDSRVTLEGSARILAQGQLQAYSSKHYRSQLVINEGKYDIETIKEGQTITFVNTNDERVTNLILQIQSVQYTPDNVTIELDTLPRPVSKRVEDLRRNLLQSDNQNNPGVAS
jgi:hypothetical protein